MADEDRKSSESLVLQKIAQSPITTVTGPLGFLGAVLWWQMTGIAEDIDSVTENVHEVRIQIVSVQARLSAIEAQASSRDKLIEQASADVRDLRSRVDRLEAAERRAHDKE